MRGLYAAYTVLAVLRDVERTSKGAHIDCSMLGSLLGVSALQTSEYFGTGVAPKRLGSAHPRNTAYQAFEASDTYFVIAAGNSRLYGEVCEAVGLPELVDDDRFKTQLLRVTNQADLVALLQPKFRMRTVRDWLQEMDARNVPCAPINNFAEILNDPQVAHLNIVRDIVLPNDKATTTVVYPISISGHEQVISRRSPI